MISYEEIDRFIQRAFVASTDHRCCQSRRIGRPGGTTGERCDRRVSPRHVYDYAAQRTYEKHVNLCTADEV
jgi:hypothetical protein